MRSVGSGGVGTFTTRPIQCGTLLFAEPPLLLLSNRGRWDVELLDAYDGLTDDEKQIYMDLGCNKRALEMKGIYRPAAEGRPDVPLPHPDDADHMPPANTTLEGPLRIAGIFFTNYFQLGPGPYFGFCGIFPRLSKINHSCVPNVFAGYFCGMTKKYYLRVLRDLSAGEEIFLGYGNWSGTYGGRRRGLPFNCQCALCLHPNRRLKDRERLDIHKHRNKLHCYVDAIVKGWAPDLFDEKALRLALLYLRRTQAENMYAFLPHCYECLAFAWLRNGKLHSAERSIREAESYDRMYNGHLAQPMNHFWDKFRELAPP